MLFYGQNYKDAVLQTLLPKRLGLGGFFLLQTNQQQNVFRTRIREMLLSRKITKLPGKVPFRRMTEMQFVVVFSQTNPTTKIRGVLFLQKNHTQKTPKKAFFTQIKQKLLLFPVSRFVRRFHCTVPAYRNTDKHTGVCSSNMA